MQPQEQKHNTHRAVRHYFGFVLVSVDRRGAGVKRTVSQPQDALTCLVRVWAEGQPEALNAAGIRQRATSPPVHAPASKGGPAAPRMHHSVQAHEHPAELPARRQKQCQPLPTCPGRTGVTPCPAPSRPSTLSVAPKPQGRFRRHTFSSHRLSLQMWCSQPLSARPPNPPRPSVATVQALALHILPLAT